MTTISTDKARGGTASSTHRVLKILLVSLGASLIIGLAIVGLS